MTPRYDDYLSEQYNDIDVREYLMLVAQFDEWDVYSTMENWAHTWASTGLVVTNGEMFVWLYPDDGVNDYIFSPVGALYVHRDAIRAILVMRFGEQI